MQTVFSALSDMQRFAALHPVITRIDLLHESIYLIHETMKVGFIPVSFTYKAMVVSDPVDFSVSMLATVKRKTHIHLLFRLSQTSDHTFVRELVEVSSPLPIRRIMEKVLRKQHGILFGNIERQGVTAV